VIAVATEIAEDHRCAVPAIDYRFGKSVVVQISERCAPRGQRSLKYGAAVGGNILEHAFHVPHEQKRFPVAQRRLSQLDVVHHMALRDQQVFPSVVVVVQKVRAPAGVAHRNATDS